MQCVFCIVGNYAFLIKYCYQYIVMQLLCFVPYPSPSHVLVFACILSFSFVSYFCYFMYYTLKLMTMALNLLQSWSFPVKSTNWCFNLVSPVLTDRHTVSVHLRFSQGGCKRTLVKELLPVVSSFSPRRCVALLSTPSRRYRPMGGPSQRSAQLGDRVYHLGEV